jgi:hypothetical protein
MNTKRLVATLWKSFYLVLIFRIAATGAFAQNNCGEERLIDPVVIEGSDIGQVLRSISKTHGIPIGFVAGKRRAPTLSDTSSSSEYFDRKPDLPVVGMTLGEVLDNLLANIQSATPRFN